jgi:hypothetical protein
LVAHSYRDGRERDRVAEFYQRNGNAAVLPEPLKPTGYGAYDAGCFLAGAVMVVVGIYRSRPARGLQGAEPGAAPATGHV